MDRPARVRGWRKEAQETRDLSDGLREKFSNCQRTTTSETDKFSGGFRRLRYPPPRPQLPSSLPSLWGRGSKSAERFPSKCHLFPRRFPRSSFSFKGDVLLIESPAGRTGHSSLSCREYSLNKIGWSLRRIDGAQRKRKNACFIQRSLIMLN